MIDTNVLLSAVIFHSYNMVRAIQVASWKNNDLLLSTFEIDEAREVVMRKWPEHIDVFEQFLYELSFETVVTPLNPKQGLFEIRDPNDYPVLYSAVIGAADVFVTGDKDFDDVEVDTPAIMTPAEFVTNFAF
ncbi:putative toxin-antitoxin system toxin component, PIN family [Bifidobacterium sp. ESL0784]|uniref:putative toxin-antitoxin system toxin component, PIN family n=1 Tax=Bifidobacterium sp. ESL0784 TaxID=2983231 RepID=UPI0023F78017|nr:putative toxin-antitoxin system toxin component, PIN family [Bifidobacterium sp. ESL0784]MDF7641089.1 putative toxin-antitoxin system toxin component, PIN family [Bifidobacterium sp. ESL0784]